MAQWLLGSTTLLLYLTMRGSYSIAETCSDAEFRQCELQYNEGSAATRNGNSNSSNSNSIANDALCQLASQALACFNALNCPDTSFVISPYTLFKIGVQVDQNRYCGNAASSTTPPPSQPTLSTSSGCMSSGFTMAANTQKPPDLAQPSIQLPAARDASCSRGGTPKPRLHCSAFGYSHLRAFGSSSIQTCLLPGSWFLFKHQLLTVELFATAGMDSTEPYTMITKINITLFDHTCFSKQRSYVATANSSLPQMFLDGYRALGILQLSDAMTATLLVPWINTTIVIRSDQGLLSVTLHVPLDILSQGLGLCLDSCSGHTYLSPSPYVNKWSEACLDASNQALILCVLYSNTFNVLLEIRNYSYVLICQFELLLTSSNDTLRFMRAVISDAMLLPNTDQLTISDIVINLNGGATMTSSSSSSSSSTLSSGNKPTSAVGTAASLVTQATTHSNLDTPKARSSVTHLSSSLLSLVLAALLSFLNR